jgi:predicted esterase
MIAEDLADFPGLAASFEANRIRGFEAEFPVQIWQGTLDDVVLLSDTAELVADLEASGMEIDFQVVEGAGHVNLAFGFVAFQEMRTEESIAWVKSRLED